MQWNAVSQDAVVWLKFVGNEKDYFERQWL